MMELSGVMVMFYFVIGMIVTQVYVVVKTHQTVHLRAVRFIL